MSTRRQVVESCALCVLALSALALSAAPAAAQQESRSTIVPVSLRVQAQTTFDGGVSQRAAAVASPAGASRAEPTAGVYARMGYDVITRVVVSGSPLQGPGGTVVPVRLACSLEGSASGSAGEPFDCGGGLLARVEERWRRTGTRVTPVAVLAAVHALDTVSVPLGRYTGRVVVTATSPAY